MGKKEEFLDIYNTYIIKRKGAEKLLKYIESTDFFTAPASTRFHGAYEGGLVEHSVNVYQCLKNYLERERVKQVYNMNYSDESIAIVSLLHDLCKANFYTIDYRNAKIDGEWQKVPYYAVNESFPYGHGEKSVFLISRFMYIEPFEAMAIRYHMGFSGIEDKNTIGRVFESFPLAFALNIADMEASYFLEGTDSKA
jgi:hypothetical protein